jgi:hypothetical protein
MTTLSETLKAANRRQLLDDVVRVINGEVASKGGVSGLALKGGYRVVRRLKGGRMIHLAADNLLDDFALAIDPVWEEFQAEGSEKSFTRYLSCNERRAADALLSITDRRARRAENRIIKKTYAKLRGQAEKHVIAALPAVGRLIEKYAG